MGVIRFFFLVSGLLLFAGTAGATVFGSVRGIVHDPQHRPVEGSTVTIGAKAGEWSQTATTNRDGEFRFTAVPLGEYTIRATSEGFQEAAQDVVVNSGTEPVLHLALKVSGERQTVTVSETAEAAPTDTVTPTTMVSREDVQKMPGASRTNSLAMITDFTPGAYITHDQLHIRGGHQVSWLIDGVPVPNSNIASNVGPQFDPKDVDYMEVQRGSYSALFGDRTYGVFNIAPRTGFERNNDAELVTSFGNFYQTNDQFNLGGHTQRFAYYASVNGNRSNLGLQTPTAQVIHDAENGYGGFGSLIFNVDGANQLRLVTSLRKDYYQIPYDPNPNSSENQEFPTFGLRDGQHEADGIVNFSWVHTFNSRSLLTVSPFYHYNSTNYDGDPNDFPVSTTDERASHYGGGQVTLSTEFARNNLQVGFYGFGQHDNELFGVQFNDNSGNMDFRQRELASGNVAAFFVDDKFKVTPWLTLMAGMRPTRFSGGITESAISPRFGAALQVPKLKWVFRGFYGHYYQAPPLLTVSGPLLEFVNSNNLGFVPLQGERDEEHQFGVTIPLHKWTLDADTFKTIAHNFFDHNNVGESDIFFPLTIEEAVIRGWELTLRSQMIAKRVQIHLAYSNQVALAGGAITGGLTDFSLPEGLSPLDHDQRNTLNVGGVLRLPWRSYASTNVYYGSGFTNGNPPPAYLPGHTTVDLSLGKDFGERLSASVNALNVANRHLLIDNSVTFGGFHWNNPREIYVELRYRFHY
ncbi:MAG TPA: TonB-dependent receptor [Terriglobales bacterium]|nr:TonB-dependent receptor [Terriglobales bacterium]